jgi:hypothetical protein
MRNVNKKVGFTGTQRGMTSDQMHRLPPLISECFEFHHGGCVGSDQEAHNLALPECITIVVHPCNIKSKQAVLRWPVGYNLTRLPEKPPFECNWDIVRAVDVLIAAPKGRFMEMQGSGTWATVRYARKLDKPVVVIFPEGEMELWSSSGRSQLISSVR